MFERISNIISHINCKSKEVCDKDYEFEEDPEELERQVWILIQHNRRKQEKEIKTPMQE